MRVHSDSTWRIRRYDLCSGSDAGCRYQYCYNLSILHETDTKVVTFSQHSHNSFVDYWVLCRLLRKVSFGWIKRTNKISSKQPKSYLLWSMNRDEGSYQLKSYVRPLSWLDSNLSRQEPEPASSDRGRNVKSKEFFGCFDEIFISMLNSTKWNFSQ